jgi:hypothetical protein
MLCGKTYTDTRRSERKYGLAIFAMPLRCPLLVTFSLISAVYFRRNFVEVTSVHTVHVSDRLSNLVTDVRNSSNHSSSKN